MATNNFFIQEHLERKVFHGGIGNVDAEKVFVKKGFKPILFPFHHSFSLRAKLVRIWYLIKTVYTLPGDANVFFQFPMYAGMSRSLTRLLGYRKSIRVICFLTDIDGLKDGNDRLLEKEIQALRRYRYFIVHNDAMKQWLLACHPLAKISVIDFFDFLTQPVIANRQKKLQIAFAGYLSKSPFLERLGELQSNTPDLEFNVYGKDPSPLLLKQPNVQYRGFSEPYALTTQMDGSFGLVWDGGDIDNPSDNFGRYMRYISHHKLSLYILAGLPIITWSGAASAPLVRHYKIGITVDNLRQLKNVIDAVTEEEYQSMVTHTNELAKSISAGERLGKAIDEILGMS